MQVAVAAQGGLKGEVEFGTPRGARAIPIVTARFVRAAHRAGLPVHVWTVNDESPMHDLLDLGVDGIMTDRPSLLRDVLAAPRPARRR